jgi:hypothetical protein
VPGNARREVVVENEPAQKTPPALPERARSEKPNDEKPWMWASKNALRSIRDRLGDSHEEIGRARNVYFAFCELASNREASRFQASKVEIANLAGVHSKTVQRVLPILEALGLIRVERSGAGIKSGLKVPSTYTLLSVIPPSGQYVPSIGLNVPSIGQDANKGQLSDRIEEGSVRTDEKNKNPSAPVGAVVDDRGRVIPIELRASEFKKLCVPPFLDAWADWCAYLKMKHHFSSPGARHILIANFKKLSALGVAKSITLIKETIEVGRSDRLVSPRGLLQKMAKRERMKAAKRSKILDAEDYAKDYDAFKRDNQK